MPIPDYQTAMLPVLQLAGTQPVVSLQEAREHVAKVFFLSEEEIHRRLASGSETVLRNRVGWARTFLKKSELVTYPSRGHFSITSKGIDLLKQGLKSIDVALLKTFPEFEKNWSSRQNKSPEPHVEEKHLRETPREAFERSFVTLKENCLEELKDRLQTCSSSFFEHIVVQTVVAMGYGGSVEDAGQAIGKSGDGGVDGIIKEDRLGLDVIYLQAKKWEAKVGRPEIQKFAGALQGKRARKGIFITTSDFSNEARNYARDIENRIVLLSGSEFCELMWEHNLGVSTGVMREVKEVHPDFFTEE